MPTVQPTTSGRMIASCKRMASQWAAPPSWLPAGASAAMLLAPEATVLGQQLTGRAQTLAEVHTAPGELLWVWGEDCVWHSVISDSGMSARCQQHCRPVHVLVSSPPPCPCASFWGPHVRKSCPTLSSPQDGKPESSYSISSFLHIGHPVLSAPPPKCSWTHLHLLLPSPRP